VSNQPSNFMEQSTVWNVHSHSASQEIPRQLRNPKGHYCYRPLSWARWLSILPSLKSFRRIRPIPRPCVTLGNKLFFFYSEKLLALRPIPKLEDYPLLAVRDCLLNIFAVNLHICGRIIRIPGTLRDVTGTHGVWEFKLFYMFCIICNCECLMQVITTCIRF
jgi:hypothetical protein